MTVLDLMNSRYKINVAKLACKNKNFEEIQESRQYLSSFDVPCVKYNYSLDQEVQNFSCFEALIRLTPEFKTLEIFNMKQIPNHKYVLESDPCELERMRIREQIVKIKVKLNKIDEDLAMRVLLE